VVAAGVLVVGVVPGIMIGVLISLVYLLGRLAADGCGAAGIARDRRYHDLNETPATQTLPGLIAYRFYAPLIFANAEYFGQRVRELVESSPSPVHCVVLDMQAVWEIDVTAAEMMSRLVDELRQKGITLVIARANRPLREKLERIGLKEQFYEKTYFSSVHKAIEVFRQRNV